MSHRAERILVRVLLQLRREARVLTGRGRGARDVEELTDAILADFPRRLVHLGMVALCVIAMLCMLPLLRDWMPIMRQQSSGSGSVALSLPVANVVESRLRNQRAAMGDGIETLRAVVAPFAAESPATTAEKVEVPSDAAAPFKKS